ncbi:MAG TPA: DUF3592 domain-containing protein [Anaerolineales bacterium]|nr:DUF3592 domain-containing protein [Anaerolineales bacterium]HNQ93037.1 DUF3592 domain-containing protein [Anaerolineales bacterium]HNS60377.1 DUF3592 domain-containing protein [Anaerolineales bacterium]
MSNESMMTVGILGCVFVILNVVFLAIIFFTQRKMNAVQSWSSAMGTVMASYLERRSSSDGSTNYPVVQYSYQVGGQAYQGAKIAPGMEVGGTGAGRVVEKYPQGAQVMVFYDPNNPSDAVLEKKARAQWLMWLLLVVFDVMLCGMAIAFGFAF